MSESLNTFYELIETIESIGILLDQEVEELAVAVFSEKDLNILMFLKNCTERCISSVKFFLHNETVDLEYLKILEAKKAIVLTHDSMDLLIALSPEGLRVCEGGVDGPTEKFKQSFVKLPLEDQKKIYSTLEQCSSLIYKK